MDMADEAAIKEEETETAERSVYELGYHIVPTTAEDQVSKEVSTIKEVVEKLGGAFISEESPTFITLAYTMMRSRGGKREKFTTAHFGWMKFEMGAAHAPEFKEKLDVNEHVLRYVLFKTVREDTRAPKRILEQRPAKPAEPIRPKLTEAPKTKEPGKEISDEELDRTIRELVVE